MSGSMGDRRLVRDLGAGRQEAYLEAVDRHYQRIYAFLRHMTQSDTLAEDLTQETFASAWRSLHQFDGRASFATWLHKIALNAYRGSRRGQGPPADTLDDERIELADDAPSLLDQLSAQELRQQAQEAVKALPEIYREVVVLRCYQDLKYREIADLLGVPLGTVQFRLHTALKRLQAELREEVIDREPDMAPIAGES